MIFPKVFREGAEFGFDDGIVSQEVAEDRSGGGREFEEIDCPDGWEGREEVGSATAFGVELGDVLRLRSTKASFGQTRMLPVVAGAESLAGAVSFSSLDFSENLSSDMVLWKSWASEVGYWRVRRW